jgi:hypothetical protein
MRSNRYIKVLGLVAALVAFGAIGAAVAQAEAPIWTVKASGVTKNITSAEEREGTASSTGTVSLGFNAQTVKSTTSGDCTASLSIKGSAAENPGTITPLMLICKNVESSVPNCTVHSTGAPDGIVVSTPLKATLVWLAQSPSGEAGILFEPEAAGGTFAHIEETGAACAVNTEGESLTVTGKVICKVTIGAGADVNEGQINCPATPITKYFTNQTPTRTEDLLGTAQLKVAGAAAIFNATFDIKPKTAGEEWGIGPISAPVVTAPIWTVKASGVTKTIAASEEREGTASSTGTVSLGFSAQTLKSTTSGDCTASLSIRGSAAETPGTITPFTLTCIHAESSVPNCTVHSTGAPDGTVVSTKIKATLVWLAQSPSGEAGILFEPEAAGGTFAHIEETGAACAVNTEGESLTVTGKVICKVTKGAGADVNEGQINCPATPITKYFTNQTPTRTEDLLGTAQLKVAGAAAIFNATFDIKPKTAGEEWGIGPISAPGVAKAPVWTVKAAGVSRTITSAEEREGTDSSTGTVSLGFAGQTLKSTTSGDCTASFTIRGSAAETPGTITPFALTCKNVESSGPNCTVHGTGAADGTVVSTNIKGTLVWLAASGDEAGILFESETVGGAFAHIEETGAACALNTEGESLTVSGKVICRVTKGFGEDTTEGSFECPGTPITKYFTNQISRTEDLLGVEQLKVAGAAAIFSATFDIKPKTAEEEWGIETG